MMTAAARGMDGPHGGAEDPLHKMAAAASTLEDRRVESENRPTNANKVKTETKQHSESDDAAEDDEGDDDEDDKNRSVTSSRDSDANGAADDDKKASKKSRRELPPHTVAILKGWMLSPEHVKHPYPTDEDKQMLLKKTGINMKQLTNWFTNARKRIWKPMMRREHSRQLQTAMEYEQGRESYPGATPPMPMYRDGGVYPPPQGMRHSFDAGSMGGPPREHMPYHHPYNGPPPPSAHGYPMAPAHAYPPRVMRSVSESSTVRNVDDYIDAMRIRKRVHEMGPDAVEAEGMAHPDKRFRRMGAVPAPLSPRCLRILQDWVASHSHMEYPTPADSDKLQLSRDTGLDVQQIELWFKNNVGRFGAPPQATGPPPNAPPSAPAPHGHPAYRSIPSRDNPMYPPPPAYGERRSIPSQGNPMFPPRPGVRSSIPSAGNPQFPPPPAVRRDGSDGYRGPQAYPGGSYPPPTHPGYPQEGGGDLSRPIRTMSINSGYSQQAPPAPAIPTPVGAPVSNLPALSRPGGPTMGQARDGRSHTLDMGQFADARRRKMNFQDILASTSSSTMPPHQVPVAPRPPLGANGGGARPPNAENIHPTTEVPASYAQKGPQHTGPTGDSLSRI